MLAFALLYVVLGLVGRSTTIEGTPFGLVWPAGGVAVLWFLVRGAQARSVDTAVLVLASFVVNWVTGASPGISAVLVATNVLQTLLAVALLRRWCPRLWGCGGDHALDSPRVLARYLAAMSLATAAGALLGMTAFAAIEGHLHAMGGVLWFGRNLCSVLTVTTLGLLLGQRFAGGRPRRAAADTGGGNRLELLAAVACATGMYALGLELRRTEAEAVYEASVRDAIIGSMAEGLLVADDAGELLVSNQAGGGGAGPDLAHEFVSRVRSSSARMHALIGGLLDHATSDARAFDPTRVDVAAMVAEVAAVRHAEGPISCGPIPAVAADSVLLRQVVDNLLGNALTYVASGEEPKVEVTAETRDGLVVVSVADHGIGLPAGEHDRIFDEFHLAHFRDYEGLSICRRIVSRHGGTIVARDNPAGRGTVFEFTLPEHHQVGAGHVG